MWLRRAARGTIGAEAAASPLDGAAPALAETSAVAKPAATALSPLQFTWDARSWPEAPANAKDASPVSPRLTNALVDPEAAK